MRTRMSGGVRGGVGDLLPLLDLVAGAGLEPATSGL
jgi:hypothetical protein